MPDRFSPADLAGPGAAATDALGWGAATGAGYRQGPDADGDLAPLREGLPRPESFTHEVAREIGVDLTTAARRLPAVRQAEAVTHGRRSRRDR
ncbi:hypothetical protein [Caldinitratiruptor microaerophilus]|uniref:Uncharacterized protein n=1 Tax=Caldinitratiruptor microaerophilus TaxID=671077 RepID=A0AA35G9P7_9FIRM|nr:hypothetical protein [Caldinitratiruptor microaerophilus]BDG62301.1 hypothetical protein caldi_33910 [Caldinitratiruptor microaerophilus]